jgi:hypothetical protein
MVAAVAWAAFPAAPTATAKAPCVRAAYREVARSGQAVALVKRGDPGVKAACMLRRDKLLSLSDPNDDYVSHVTLVGHFVAFYDHFIDGANPDFETAQFRVVDVKRRRDAFTDRTTSYNTLNQDPPRRGLPVVIQLRKNGSVAWTTCPWHESGGSFGEPLRCDRQGPGTQFQVLAHSATAADHSHGRILDEGPTVDPSSLRLRGSALTWRDGHGTQRGQLR